MGNKNDKFGGTKWPDKLVLRSFRPLFSAGLPLQMESGLGAWKDIFVCPICPEFVFFVSIAIQVSSERLARNSTRESMRSWRRVKPMRRVASIQAAAVAGPGRRKRKAW